MKNISRRSFMKNSLAACSAASVFAISGTSASGQILGANDRVRVGVVGFRGRGNAHINEFGRLPNVEVVALVDVDRTLHGKGIERVEKQFKNTPQAFQDMRKALEMKDLDAVSIATCNHTHSILSLWAMQAGKDVYVEKPCSHNLHEGSKLVEAAEKYKRIVQHGTQSRSSVDKARLAAAARSGKYGKLQIAKGYCCKPRWTIGFKPTTTPPETLDFDGWLGPAPMQPYHENIVHYNWHWFWDFGNGDIGNQGVHEMDVCSWGIGPKWPTKVLSFGARYVNEPGHGFKDQGQTPNMQLALYEFDDCMLLFETRGLVVGKNVKSAKEWKNQVDIEFYTDQGMLRGDRFYPNGSKESVKIKLDDFTPPRPGGPFGNFIDCVRDRKRENLNADISVGHVSSAFCQFGNISFRRGGPASLDAVRSAFGSNPIVQKGIDNVTKNLADALPELKEPQWALGKQLMFDGAAQRFVNEPEADKFLTREYRKPYVVGDQV